MFRNEKRTFFLIHPETESKEHFSWMEGVYCYMLQNLMFPMLAKSFVFQTLEHSVKRLKKINFHFLS